MERCQYGNCQNEGTIKGFVIAKEIQSNGSKFVDVIACEKHSKLRSFYDYCQEEKTQ